MDDLTFRLPNLPTTRGGSQDFEGPLSLILQLLSRNRVEIKDIRLSPNIDTNDLATKVNAARKFLTKGNRVKITLRFRGREMAHMNSSAHILSDFADALTDCATVEKAPRVEGRSMTMFLAEKR